MSQSTQAIVLGMSGHCVLECGEDSQILRQRQGFLEADIGSIRALRTVPWRLSLI